MRRIVTVGQPLGKLKLKKVQRFYGAPHVSGPGRQVMRVSTVIQSPRGTAPRSTEYGIPRSAAGKGYSNSNGRYARASTHVPDLEHLTTEAQLALEKAKSKIGKQGLSRCKCLGKCGCGPEPYDVMADLERLSKY